MKLEITVPEVLSIFKEIQQRPERIFEIIKMELHWRSNPVGKVQKNLPFFKGLEEHEFTQ